MRAALLALLLAGCATLTAQQATGLAEAKAFVQAAARAYGVWTPGIVAGPTANEGGYYKQGTIFVRNTVLTSPVRDALLAHEFAHYLLGHEPHIIHDRHAWQREQEERERQANIKSVEILMRAKGISQAQAVQLVRQKLERIARAYERGVAGSWVPGHKPPKQELADLMAVFPSPSTSD